MLFYSSSFIDLTNYYRSLCYHTLSFSSSVSPAVTALSRVAANVQEVAELRCLSQANPPPVFHWKRAGQVK